MKLKIALFCLIGLSIFSCKNKEKDSPKVLPPVPEQYIVDAFNTIDHIDYYFRNTNFSVSQSEEAAVKNTISLLSAGKANNPQETCVSPLRMTYLSQGNIVFETEMYMTEGCMYVEYYINNVKTYQSSHSEEGYNFLVNIIKQATASRG